MRATATFLLSGLLLAGCSGSDDGGEESVSAETAEAEKKADELVDEAIADIEPVEPASEDTGGFLSGLTGSNDKAEKAEAVGTTDSSR